MFYYCKNREKKVLCNYFEKIDRWNNTTNNFFFLIPYYSVDLFFLIILDKLSLLIVFFLILITCLKYKKTDGIVLCYFIMVLLRYMKTFF